MSLTYPKAAHSAYVEMRLKIESDTLAVAQMGPGLLILDEPAARDYAPQQVQVNLRIDDSLRELTPYLKNGITAGEEVIRF